MTPAAPQWRRCAVCGRCYGEEARTSLALLGVQRFDPSLGLADLELRQCPCRNTLSFPVTELPPDPLAPRPPLMALVPSASDRAELPPEVLALQAELAEVISVQRDALDFIAETMREQSSASRERSAILSRIERERATAAEAEPERIRLARSRLVRWVLAGQKRRHRR